MNAQDIEAVTGLIPTENQKKYWKKRASKIELASVPHTEVDEFEKNGWHVDRRMKTRTRMARPKDDGKFLEDQCWHLFSKLGFPLMSGPNGTFFEKNEGLKKQIDVAAFDENLALFVECKYRGIEGGSLRKEIEQWRGWTADLQKLNRQIDRKVISVFCSNRVKLNENDQKLLDDAGVKFLSITAINHFLKMEKEIGELAKVQFLAWLLPKVKVPGVSVQVPAIRGKSGRQDWFLFQSNPRELSRLVSVLHRVRGVRDLSDAYQRILKKSRLSKVFDFVENGGSFANNIIVNINCADREFRWEKMSGDGFGFELGTLTLPKTYGCIEVIDGQHRLLAYGKSGIKGSHSLPVFAYLRLPRDKQVELFMDINANQKAVPKNLKNTLDAQLNFGSKVPKEAKKGLENKLAVMLGEDPNSPLVNLVRIGEGSGEKLTVEALRGGIDKGLFSGQLAKGAFVNYGWFGTSDMVETFNKTSEFLTLAFGWLKSVAPPEDSKFELVWRNPFIQAFLLLIGREIIGQWPAGLALKNGPKLSWSQVKKSVENLPLFIDHLGADQGKRLREQRGGGAVSTHLKFLKVFLSDHSKVHFEGIEELKREMSRANNVEAKKLVEQLEESIRGCLSRVLEEEYGDDWFFKAIPKEVQVSAVNNAPSGESPGVEHLNFGDYKKIVWAQRDLREGDLLSLFTLAEDTGQRKKSELLHWISGVIESRNNASHSRPVTDSQLASLRKVANELCPKMDSFE